MSQLQASFQVDRGDFQLDVDFILPGKGITALFGPSGSGKTSCLRAIAGLERLPNSFFQIGDKVWQDESKGIFIPANQREIGYVFQEASLFPHLNVQQNLEFGLNRLAKEKRKIEPDSVIVLLGIGPLLSRPPAALSGGERQRVAIARALLRSPQLLLMDEPLSALDQRLKREILPYLEGLHRELSIPVIYVSHAADEVVRLADHIVMLDQGKHICSGAISEIMVDPRFAELFADGASTLFEGRVTAQHEDLMTEVTANELTLRLTPRPLPLESPIRCRLYASDVSLCTQKPSHSSILNIFQGQVLRIDAGQQKGESLVTLELAKGQKLLAQISNYSLNRLQLKLGTPIWAQVKSVAVL
ncbi:molybdenum ABC transporter ATP-binding protein [Psychromonas antarctica]|jgi:molybdate transport system ATP-binding protein|uniref:molybdenum ABC transporter ATP-binding protein n=1 Tax=Psychromonas antarctica TaxID=67573 RepID=UPI001EE902BE|nr:molybdenum ABC transporter ATP-binding protein [Psychromonas antarctica]MCG6200287.1 molybdenum ABC transporter ATP-binding protein [Psychromonas antarctica]